MSGNQPLFEQYPGGCYLGFNAAIDRKAAEAIMTSIKSSQQAGFDTINLSITSVGGIMDQTYYLFNMIESLPLKMITWNVGNIQSAANILFLCGDERYAVPNSTFFFHQVGFDGQGRFTAPYIQERLKALQYDDLRSATIVAHKSGKPLEEVRVWQNTELVMDTKAALDHGLIHDVREFRIPPDAFFHQIVV